MIDQRTVRKIIDSKSVLKTSCKLQEKENRTQHETAKKYEEKMGANEILIASKDDVEEIFGKEFFEDGNDQINQDKLL